MSELKLTEIWIYPVKSLGGISLNSGTVLNKGLKYDRRWMLIDESGDAMTQRDYPQMALFRPKIKNGILQVDYIRSGQIVSSVEFSTSQPGISRISARVWDDEVLVGEVDANVSHWFAKHLELNCKFVSFPEENRRRVNPAYAVGDNDVSLADAYPFLIIGQASLDDLNQRLTQSVPMNRFRPNFVFTGGTAFVEDTWKSLTIGTIPFAAVKKSDRCVMTTVDQESAVKGAEPLRTLSSYRRVENKVYFGQNLIGLKQGTVAVGDIIIPQ